MMTRQPVRRRVNQINLLWSTKFSSERIGPLQEASHPMALFLNFPFLLLQVHHRLVRRSMETSISENMSHRVLACEVGLVNEN